VLFEYLLLSLAAMLAGAVNAVAGGGTLLTFPALLAALGSSGSAAVVANATSTVALVPGAIAALAGYRDEIRHERRWTMFLLGPSLVGGFIGSLLLVTLPGETFKSLVPWLILTAALLFALQPQISKWAGLNRPNRAPGDSIDGAETPTAEMSSATVSGGPRGSSSLLAAAIGFQFLVAIYGGYFGAGIGILMLSALAIMGMEDIHRMNAVKTALNLVINGTSVLVFVASGQVHWRFAAIMAASSIVGGYVAARTVRTFNKRLVRSLIVTIGFSLAAYYFYRQFAS
jgi:uncharacterized membrane protein YfcA